MRTPLNNSIDTNSALVLAISLVGVARPSSDSVLRRYRRSHFKTHITLDLFIVVGLNKRVKDLT